MMSLTRLQLLDLNTHVEVEKRQNIKACKYLCTPVHLNKIKVK